MLFKAGALADDIARPTTALWPSSDLRHGPRPLGRRRRDEGGGIHGKRFVHEALNAWCELRSPLQQISESQPRTTKLLVEPDTEIVQRYPRRQASSQAFQLTGPLPPEAEGIEELVVDRLDDLAYSSYPSSQALGPVPLAGVALGRVDDAHPVAFQPASMVFFALKALVGYVGSPGRRSHARQPRVRSMPDGEEGLGHLLVGGRSSTEAKTRDDTRRIDSQSKRKPSYHPRLLLHPMSARPANHPSPWRFASLMGIAELSRAS